MSLAQEQLQDETHRVVLALEAILGRTSQWSGRVTLTDNPDVRGRKPFSCDIVLNENLTGLDVRWRTIIHEALHSFSAGYNFTDYQLNRGWEEGVVESLQRLWRQKILRRLGLVVENSVFIELEIGHDYNTYIDALERLRSEFS